MFGKSRITHFQYLFILLLLTGVSQVSEAQDTEVTFDSGDLTIYGTLSIPEGEGPFPVVVFVHGSGPNDRDQTFQVAGGNAACLYPGIFGETVRNFRDLANVFRVNGLAVLRYDKRTFTYQSELDPEDISPYDFIADIHAAVDFVKAREELDASCIMLLGHSQGANFIPIVAQERSDISILLALGAPARGIDTLLAMQFRELYYYCQEDTLTGDLFYNQTLSDFEAIRDGTWNDNTPYLGAYPKFWRDWIEITDSAVYHFNTAGLPTLFLQGTNDFNIPLADAERFAMQLDLDTFDVFYLEDLNHFFTSANVPTVAQVVPDTIFHWLEENKFNTSATGEIQQSHLLTIIDDGSTILLKMENGSSLTQCRLYNIQGQLVGAYPDTRVNFIEIQKQDYLNGIYVFSGLVEGKYISTKLLLN